MSARGRGDRVKRSLFSRYFSLCAWIILVSITVLGVILLVMAGDYFKDDRIDMLERKAHQAANIVSMNYLTNQQMYLDFRALTASFSILSTAVEADIFLTDTAGRTIICTDVGSCSHKTYVISEAVMREVINGEHRSIGRLGGIYPEQFYVVGVPVRVNDVVIGAVFTATTAAAMSTFVVELLQMFLIASCIIIFLAFVAIYFSTSTLVNPLRAMAKAADSFARGDFSIRVPVEGDIEVEQLASAFNNMASSLALQESIGRSFVANVSHELRTPMTSIGGFIDGMLDGTIAKEQYNHYLQLVSNEVKRLTRMVVSMLNISRIEAGEMQLKAQVVDVNEIVCRAMLGFEQQLESKHIDVRGLDSPKVFVSADPDMLHQICHNLIENAVKFTNEHGSIEVSYQSDGKLVLTTIRNSGEGIPKEEIPKLFERFYKSDRSRGADTKGVGLGLHIVKSLVHLHGGGITVRSAEGEYTEFEFSLPAGSVKTQTPIFRKSDKSKLQ